MAHTLKASAQEAACASLGVHGKPGLQSETLSQTTEQEVTRHHSSQHQCPDSPLSHGHTVRGYPTQLNYFVFTFLEEFFMVGEEVRNTNNKTAPQKEAAPIILPATVHEK